MLQKNYLTYYCIIEEDHADIEATYLMTACILKYARYTTSIKIEQWNTITVLGLAMLLNSSLVNIKELMTQLDKAKKF